MIIYQLKPTIVAKVNNEIVKIFSDNVSCEEEFERLHKVSKPLIERDNDNEYEMSVVKAMFCFRNILIMEHANGIPLIKTEPLQDMVALVGNYLAKFHQKNYEVDGVYSPRIFGDFSIDHVYINSDDQVISTIDPGANFLVIGNQLEDVARFLFSTTETFRYKPLASYRVIKAFLHGYIINKDIDFNDLKEVLDFRKERSVLKYRLQKSPFRARIGAIILNYNRLVIWWALKY